MDQIEIGDLLRDTPVSFAKVFSFGHRNVNRTAQFLQIHVTGLEQPLEMSKEHMVLIRSTKNLQVSQPASLLKVGDELVTALEAVAVVTKVEVVTSKGMFAPFTTSGFIMVNNVVSSSYVALQESAVLVVGGLATPFSMQWMAHAFNAPHRMVCQYISWNFCQHETYTDIGISHWVAQPLIASNWVLDQDWAVMALTFGPCVATLLVFSMVEHLLDNKVALLIAILPWAAYYATRLVSSSKRSISV